MDNFSKSFRYLMAKLLYGYFLKSFNCEMNNCNNDNNDNNNDNNNNNDNDNDNNNNNNCLSFPGNFLSVFSSSS